jgi:hypothetical protein
MTNELRQRSRASVESDLALRLLIARVCGHYVYDLPDIQQARKALYENVQRQGLVADAREYVTRRVRESIGSYIEHLGLTDVNKCVPQLSCAPSRRATTRRTSAC